MKLKTLSCKKTIVWKNITRSAPLWALYFIGGLLVMLTMFDWSDKPAEYARALSGTIGLLSVVNLVYAALVAQLVFGDLFNSRLCYALHAMPLRRESWFVSHAVSGLLFSLIPHMAVLPILLAFSGELWYIAFIWLLGMLLSYLFFFGVAVFSVFCTGNRFSMAAVYCIINFGAQIAFWFWDTLCTPMMYGIVTPQDIFNLLTPEMHLINANFVKFEHYQLPSGRWGDWQYAGLVTESWVYLGIIATIGVSLLVVSLLLYRRRALEAAGDFISIKPLKPVFSVIVTLATSCIFAMFGSLFNRTGTLLLFLAAGFVIGFFASQMMLQRMVRIFNPKTFLWLGILALCFGGCMGVVALDPFGVVTWVPEAAEVEYAEISNGYAIHKYAERYMMIQEEADIDMLTEVHRLAVEEGEATRNQTTYTICYHMKDGRVITRQYVVNRMEGAYSAVKELYGRANLLLGYTDWDEYVESVEKIYIHNRALFKNADPVLIRELLECIRQDVELGKFDGEPDSENATYVCGLEIVTNSTQKHLSVYDDAVNTSTWLKEHQQLWKDKEE